MDLQTFAELTASIAAAGVPAEVDGDQRVVEIHAACGAVCLRWDEGLPLVHIIAPLYGGVTSATASQVAETVARLNHELPLPGLAVDADSGLIYFRWVMARGPSGLSLEQLDTLLALVIDEIAGVRHVLMDTLGSVPPAHVGADAQRALADLGAWGAS